MRYLLAAAVITVVAASPAAAKSAKMSCAGDGPGKMVTSMNSMPYDQKRLMMDRQVNAMNTAMSKGDMRGCNNAMSGKMAKSKKG
jgi:hypothetical protein